MSDDDENLAGAAAMLATERGEEEKKEEEAAAAEEHAKAQIPPEAAPDESEAEPEEEPLSDEELAELLKKQKLEKKLIAIPFILVFLVWAYGAFWSWSANQIKQEIELSFKSMAKDGIYKEGKLLPILGFPARYIIRFEGKILTDDVSLEIPYLSVESNLRLGSLIKISLPKGIKIAKPEDASIWSMDKLLLKAVIPKTMPESMSQDDLWEWRQKGNGLRIHTLRLTKRDLTADGNGRIYLDQHLQPTGKFFVRLEGIDTFLSYLHEQDVIDTKTMLISRGILSGFEKKDASSSTSYFATDIILQNRSLFLGPLQVASFPMIQWQ